MPQHTVEAFKWSGTGYNAQYETSYSATIDDDDGVYNGSSDGNESISINGGSFGATAGPGYAIDVSFTDVDGEAHTETFHFFNTDSEWYFVPGPDSEFTVGATLGSYQSHTSSGWNYDDVACFVKGTLIDTKDGPQPVERLKVGSMVLSAEGTFEPLRLSLSRQIPGGKLRQNPKLMPVRIMAGALGNGLPKRDLLVSRQHRMRVSSRICGRMFNQTDALVAAIRLTELPGIFVETKCEPLVYFHLVFDSHKVIFAEGAPTESLLLGPQALRSMSPAAREEILTILPEIEGLDFDPAPACYIPKGNRQKRLVFRHIKNNQPLI